METNETSAKSRAIVRAKALAVLLLPFLVIGALAALLAVMQRGPHGTPVWRSGQTTKGGWLSATAPGATVDVTEGPEGTPGSSATTVTTYTVSGEY